MNDWVWSVGGKPGRPTWQAQRLIETEAFPIFELGPKVEAVPSIKVEGKETGTRYVVSLAFERRKDGTGCAFSIRVIQPTVEAAQALGVQLWKFISNDDFQGAMKMLDEKKPLPLHVVKP